MPLLWVYPLVWLVIAVSLSDDAWLSGCLKILCQICWILLCLAFLDIGAKHSGTSWIFKNLAKYLQIKLTKKSIAFFDQESLKKPSRYCQMLVPNPWPVCLPIFMAILPVQFICKMLIQRSMYDCRLLQ